MRTRKFLMIVGLSIGLGMMGYGCGGSEEGFDEVQAGTQAERVPFIVQCVSDNMYNWYPFGPGLQKNNLKVYLPGFTVIVDTDKGWILKNEPYLFVDIAEPNGSGLSTVARLKLGRPNANKNWYTGYMLNDNGTPWILSATGQSQSLRLGVRLLPDSYDNVTATFYYGPERDYFYNNGEYSPASYVQRLVLKCSQKVKAAPPGGDL